MIDRHFFIIAYDIRENRRRAKLARLMESLGARVQGSVFEAYLTPKELEEMIKKANDILAPEEDTLRIYFLCEECRKKIRVIGTGSLSEPPEFIII